LSGVPFQDKIWVAQNGPSHLQQLYFTSSWLSSACADEGLRVSPPLDLRLVNKEAAETFLIQFTESKPDLVFITLPSPKKNPEAFALCWKVAVVQVHSGRHVVIEDDCESSSRHSEEYCRVCHSFPGQLEVTPLELPVHNPKGHESRERLAKSTAWLSNMPRLSFMWFKRPLESFVLTNNPSACWTKATCSFLASRGSELLLGHRSLSTMSLLSGILESSEASDDQLASRRDLRSQAWPPSQG